MGDYYHMVSTVKILWVSREDLINLGWYMGFQYCASSVGASIDPVKGGVDIGYENILRQIREADCYIVSLEDCVRLEQIRAVLVEEIRSKQKRCLVLAINELNPFLAEFDITMMPIRFFSYADSVTEDPRKFVISAECQDLAVQTSLLDGVRDIGVESPQMVSYQEEATSLLRCEETVDAIDEGDLLVDLQPRYNTFASIWPVTGLFDKSGGVIAIGAGGFNDPSLNQLGDYSPGIIQNFQLLQNTLKWLKKELPPPNFSLQGSQLVHNIEVSLHDIVTIRLQQQLGEKDWWNKGVPLEVRRRAADKKEQDNNSIKEKTAYFDLLDYKKVIEKNWNLCFKPLFEKPGKGKDKSLSWFTELNKIRIKIAHSTKQRYSPLTEDECKFLRRRLDFLNQLSNRLRQ